MPKLTPERLPKYRLHKPSGQAVVELSGKMFYLGVHGTDASRQKYDRLVTAWLANGRQVAPYTHDITIVEVLAAFRRHVVLHYRKDGRPTGEVRNFDDAMKPLALLYGDEPVRAFGPRKLKAVRDKKTFSSRRLPSALGLRCAG